MDLTQEMERFIQSKDLSSNSQAAYRYDLRQFITTIKEQLTAGNLAVYGASLLEHKPSVQRRKVSAVNQFLYFLYERELVERLYKIKPKKAPKQEQKIPEMVSLAPLFAESTEKDGQLIALLISQLGLTPNEIALLKWEEIKLPLGVMTVTRGQEKRVLSLPETLLPYLKQQQRISQVHVFEHGNKPYSRQWYFTRLNAFLATIDMENWNAQKLKEQYILHRLEAGDSLDQIAKQLGLKSRLSLEKYL